MRLQQWMQLTLLCFASPRVSSYQLRPPSEPLTRRSVGARIAAAAPAVAAAFLGAPRAARALDENKIDAQLKATANAGGGAADGGGAAPALSSRESIPVPSISDAPPYSKLVPLVELETAVAQWEADLQAAPRGAEGDAARARVGAALDDLCKGGLFFSHLAFYLGVGSGYVDALRYDDLDRGLVDQDKRLRIGAMVVAGPALIAARDELRPKREGDAALSLNPKPAVSLGNARRLLGDFLDRCPRADVAAARAALGALARADADGDGALSAAEFWRGERKGGALSDELRVMVTDGVWGTTVVTDGRPAYRGLVDVSLVKDGAVVKEVQQMRKDEAIFPGLGFGEF